jgi:hypothetical protein
LLILLGKYSKLRAEIDEELFHQKQK